VPLIDNAITSRVVTTYSSALPSPSRSPAASATSGASRSSDGASFCGCHATAIATGGTSCGPLAASIAASR
jgi:hypothetical protein